MKLLWHVKTLDEEVVVCAGYVGYLETAVISAVAEIAAPSLLLSFPFLLRCVGFLPLHSTGYP